MQGGITVDVNEELRIRRRFLVSDFVPNLFLVEVLSTLHKVELFVDSSRRGVRWRRGSDRRT